MAKLSENEITAADLQVYLEGYSDFAFEVSVLRLFSDAGYFCRHAGTYTDPVTSKTRQYDIHAEFDVPVAGSEATFIRLAVECKNIRANYPLLVHRVPRRQSEAFIDVVRSSKPARGGLSVGGYTYGEPVRLRGSASPYRVGEYVAKAADQVGKRPDGDIITADYDVFDRINQASHSAFDLLHASHYACVEDDSDIPVISAVIPILVVPERRLWAVDYDDAGNIVNGPVPVSHVTYFIDRAWSFGGQGNEYKTWYTLSHLEICELAALDEFARAVIKDTRYREETVWVARLEELRRRQNG